MIKRVQHVVGLSFIWHWIAMRLQAALALLFVLLTGCSSPDQEGRSRRIQTMAFGEMMIGDDQLVKYHGTPDEQLQRWFYLLTPEQSTVLTRRCIRRFDVSAEPVYTAAPRETVPGCLIWERTERDASLTIAIAGAYLEIYDYGKGEDLPAAAGNILRAQ